MKSKKHYRLLILAVIVALVCSLAACNGFRSETGESAASSDSDASSISKVDVLTSLTNEELQELITGKTTIEEIAEKRAESAAQSAAAASSSASGEAAASSDTAASSDSTETPSAPSESSSSVSTSTAQSSSSSATAAEPAYEAEIRSLINQLYGVQAKAQSGLNSAISSAKAEYKALPAENQTQAKKIAICMGKAGQLRSLESQCDKEVNSIVSQMRKILTENGQPTILADQAMSTYKSEKSAMYSSLMSQLYS